LPAAAAAGLIFEPERGKISTWDQRSAAGFEDPADFFIAAVRPKKVRRRFRSFKAPGVSNAPSSAPVLLTQVALGNIDMSEKTEVTEPAGPDSAGPLLNGFGRAFSAMRHRNFRLFWIGQAISSCGGWMQNTVFGWLTLQVTDSAFMLGVVSSISGLPLLLFSLPAGVLADHVSKRRLLLVMQSGLMVSAFVMAVLVTLGLVRFWNIALIAGLTGVLVSFDAPVRQSYVVDLASREDLSNAIALNSANFNTSRIIGPVLAALAIASFGMASVFYINSASFLAAIWALVLIKDTDRPRPSIRRPVRELFQEGLEHVWRERPVRTLLFQAAILSVFGFMGHTLMPVFARDVLNAGVKGLAHLMSSLGIGSLLGAFSGMLFSHHPNRERQVSLGGLVMAAGLFGLACSRYLWLSMGMLLLVGWGAVVQAVTINSLLQQMAPEHLHARVVSVYTMVFSGLMPFGTFLAGTIAQFWGAPAAVIFGASVCLVGSFHYLSLTCRKGRRRPAV